MGRKLHCTKLHRRTNLPVHIWSGQIRTTLIFLLFLSKRYVEKTFTNIFTMELSIDSNILVNSSNTSSPFHQVTKNAISRLIGQRDTLLIFPQNLMCLEGGLRLLDFERSLIDDMESEKWWIGQDEADVDSYCGG